MSDVGISALQEGPLSIPMGDRGSRASTQDRDLETGVPPIPANLVGWLVEATDIDAALAASFADSPAVVAAVLGAAQSQSQTAYTTMIERRSPGTLGQLNSALRWTSAYTDVTHSPELRDLMRRIELPANIGAEDHQRLLDAVRDTFQALAQKANDLERPPYGNQADLDFIKDKIARESQALIRSTGAVAYGETGKDRWGKVALTAATLTITAAPFAYAYYSNPTAWFYILGLSGAYLRTALLALGMMGAAGTTNRAIWQHVNERQLIWALPALFYSAQQYIIANANDNPGDEKAVDMGHTAKEIIEHKAFLTGVGAIEFALFVAANHPDKAAALWRKLKPKNQGSRFAQGDTMAVADEQTEEDIRKYFKAGSKLIGILNTIGDDWVEKGERMSDTQRQAMKAMRVDLAQLAGTLEAVVGGITTNPDAAQDDQADDRNERSLARRMAQAPVDWGKAALNLPQTMREMPLEEKKKLVVGVLLSLIGGILGAISSLAAIRVVALLTDYIPYYIATVLLLILMTMDGAYSTSDVARTFGSYFGGTIIGLIPSIMNLISLFVTQEGFFDIVAHNSTLGLPANATFAPGHPSLELTEHANIHGADGRINFGVMTAVTMLAMLAVGGRLGDDIAKKIIASLEASTSNDGDDSGSSRRDDDDRDDGDDRDDRDDRDEDPPRDEEEREEDEGRRRSGEVGSTSGGREGGSGAPETALAGLKKLGASVSREDVDKITKATAAFNKAKDLALSLKPEELKFDPANPPPDTSEEEIEKAKTLAAAWEQDLEKALKAESSSKAGPSTE